ncbi:hypothetical protein WNB94_06810 [Aquabacterium sp. A3]|uniref:hypothetical protein n=1 Tax=Aquabacterium sp. A3 TaxID=3132829 RepID=UPI003119C39B
MVMPPSLKNALLHSLAATAVAGVVVAVLWAAPRWPTVAALADHVGEPGVNLGVLALGLVVMVRLLARWRLRP